MAQALRIVSVERGHDPQEFSLIAFGGAGPVHAAALAEELQIPEVIIPPAPGAFSALGLVASDLRRDYSRTLYANLAEVDPARVADAIAAMEADAVAMLDAANVPEERRAVIRQADVRYRRQAYELTVPLIDGPINRLVTDALAEAFHAKHAQTYGHANRAEAVQLVNLRVTALGKLPALTLAQRADPGQREAARTQRVVRRERLRCDAGALAARAGRRARCSPVPRSSRRWIRRRSCRPAGRRGSMNSAAYRLARR